jgi:hypothetical protein
MLEGSLNFCGLKFVVYNFRDIPGRSIVDSFAMDPEDQYPEEISGQYAVLDGLVLISMVSSFACSELLFLFCSEEVHVLCTHNIELLCRVVANEYRRFNLSAISYTRFFARAFGSSSGLRKNSWLQNSSSVDYTQSCSERDEGLPKELFLLNIGCNVPSTFCTLNFLYIVLSVRSGRDSQLQILSSTFAKWTRFMGDG